MCIGNMKNRDGDSLAEAIQKRSDLKRGIVRKQPYSTPAHAKNISIASRRQ